MKNMKCVLDADKLCDNCGECRVCDLDPSKKCDNCMKCLNPTGAEYRGIQIDGIAVPDDKKSRPGEMLFGEDDSPTA